MKHFIKKTHDFTSSYYFFNEQNLSSIEIWGGDINTTTFDELHELKYAYKRILKCDAELIEKKEFENEYKKFVQDLNKLAKEI